MATDYPKVKVAVDLTLLPEKERKELNRISVDVTTLADTKGSVVMETRSINRNTMTCNNTRRREEN